MQNEQQAASPATEFGQTGFVLESGTQILTGAVLRQFETFATARPKRR